MINNQKINLLITDGLAECGNFRCAVCVQDSVSLSREGLSDQVADDCVVIHNKNGRHSLTLNFEGRRWQINW